MKQAKKICISQTILEEIIHELCCSIPGFDASRQEKIRYQKNSHQHIVDICCYPTKNILSFSNLCEQIQKIVYNYLLHEFDLDKESLQVNVDLEY